eukprot:CAMPEP_0202057084 /NCGR_PEP_ID=MMETSP0963-20130614/26899_1 /ASSEMBLY_ACC=CAM_ASM_000494 /TAXON_ID=4773 /ORGANISM="Schizochytrium aggregatum, Strain ATCC28209" /LENGTH=70 /DNA_ID=CAMNT_0048622895 /DNA_START=473 /DNA_END=681 /DNA_ORIENTATION=+
MKPAPKATACLSVSSRRKLRVSRKMRLTAIHTATAACCTASRALLMVTGPLAALARSLPFPPSSVSGLLR